MRGVEINVNVNTGSAIAVRFADLRWAGFSVQMLMRKTELSAITKLSAEHETLPIANVLLAAALLSSVVVSTFSHNATTMERSVVIVYLSILFLCLVHFARMN